MVEEAGHSRRLFRVVFTGESSMRLMEKGGDPPATWRLPFDSGPVPMITVSDLVIVEHGLPRHVRLKYVVDIEAETIDAAAAESQDAAAAAVARLLGVGTQAAEAILVMRVQGRAGSATSSWATSSRSLTAATDRHIDQPRCVGGR